MTNPIPSRTEHTEPLTAQAVAFLREKGIEVPEIGVILGSGLGAYDALLDDAIRVPYRDIPGFLTSTAPGHRGELIYGKRCGRRVLLMSGRFHYYEGYSMREIVYPVRVMAALGIKRLIITNASGAINLSFPAGSLMLVSDHINMSGDNPLIGRNEDALGVRFPDMTNLYRADLRKAFLTKAKAAGLPIFEGVYVMMTGPSFETPAEIRFLRTIGGDAVGMSSVPEALAAGHAGLEVMAISCLANAAAGVLPEPLTAEEVLTAAESVSAHFAEAVDIALTL